MRQLYLLIFLWITSSQLSAQNCDSLQFSCTSMESRCMATGSITVVASGGSGSYNYRVAGPVNKPFTSSSVITGLSAGYYQVIVEDVITNCSKAIDNVFIPGT